MARRQVILRLTEQLYNDIAAWAADDFRSVNGQIEFILSECVKQRKKRADGDMPPLLKALLEPIDDIAAVIADSDQKESQEQQESEEEY